MGLDKALEIAKEIERIALENNIPVNELIEKYKKAHSLDTTKENELMNKTNEIIPPGLDLGNGEIYVIETGETIRRVEDGF